MRIPDGGDLGQRAHALTSGAGATGTSQLLLRLRWTVASKEFKPCIALRPVVVAGGGACTALTLTIPLAGFEMVGDCDRPSSPPQVSPLGLDALADDGGLLPLRRLQ